MRPWANIDTSKGGKGDERFFLHPTFLGGVAKKIDSIMSSFLGGSGGWPGRRCTCYGPRPDERPGSSAFFRQKAALEDPGPTNGQGPVLFNGQSTAL